MSLVTASIRIDAAPAEVWQMVMDPERLGDWVTIHRRLVRADSGPARVGFTVSKKVGNAVERNRVRRRLREIVRRNAALIGENGHDYVVIGRRAALDMPFERINAEFLGAMTRLSRGRR